MFERYIISKSSKYSDREEAKYEGYKVLSDANADVLDKINAAEQVLGSLYERSLESYALAKGHPRPDEYAAMMLKNRDGCFLRDKDCDDIYPLLVKKFGKRKGIKNGRSYYWEE